MASQFPAGAAAGDIFTTGAGDTYQFLNNRWNLSSQKDFDPTFDIYSRVNSLKWGANPIVYEDVFDAIADGTIYEFGGSWQDDTTYANTLWNNAHILNIGNTTTNDPLVLSTAIKIQPGYSMVWVRVLNEGNREIHLDLWFDEGDANGGPATFCDEEILYNNEIYPNRLAPYNSGTFTPQADEKEHFWMPLILPNANGGTAYLMARNHAFSTADYWISGIAITGNNWGFSKMTSISLHRGTRIGTIGGAAADKAAWHGAYSGHFLCKRDGSGTAQPIKARLSCVDNGVDKVVHVVGIAGEAADRPQPPLFVNGTQVNVMAATLDPFVWPIYNLSKQLKVTSYKVPAALVAVNGNHLALDFQCNKLKNSIFYIEQLMCCDLRA